MTSFDRRPVSVVTDDRANDYTPLALDRSEHDAGHAEYTVIVVRTKRQQCRHFSESLPVHAWNVPRGRAIE